MNRFFQILHDNGSAFSIAHANHHLSSRSPSLDTLDTLDAGAHPRGGGEGPAPLGPEKHFIFRVSSAKLRELHL